MEESNHSADTLYVFRCTSRKHQVIRKSKANSSNCNRCEPATSFEMVAEVPRNEGESETSQFYRAVLVKEKKA